MDTGYWVFADRIFDQVGFTGFWIEDGCIHGPDGETGYRIDGKHIFGPSGDTGYIIEDGRITDITSRSNLAETSNGSDIIELDGGTIMPGFIEMHSHMHCSAETDAYQHIMTESDRCF